MMPTEVAMLWSAGFILAALIAAVIIIAGIRYLRRS